jgi:hypothetical protein
VRVCTRERNRDRLTDSPVHPDARRISVCYSHVPIEYAPMSLEFSR